MSRLTKLEREMLIRAGQFVMAGEWPWEEDDTAAAERKYKREYDAIYSAIAKLEKVK